MADQIKQTNALTEILDTMESRANAATPGPWHYQDDPKFVGKLHCHGPENHAQDQVSQNLVMGYFE